jgi:C4-type Zn-finger protein
MQLFGFEIKRNKEQDLPSVVTPSSVADGSTVVNTGVNAGGYYGMVMDLEGVIKNENDLIRRYREVAQYSDCDNAVEDIINEAIVADEERTSVEIILDDVKVSSSIKTKIREEFNNVLRILKFNERAHE